MAVTFRAQPFAGGVLLFLFFCAGDVRADAPALIEREIRPEYRLSGQPVELRTEARWPRARADWQLETARVAPDSRIERQIEFLPDAVVVVETEIFNVTQATVHEWAPARIVDGSGQVVTASTTIWIDVPALEPLAKEALHLRSRPSGSVPVLWLALALLSAAGLVFVVLRRRVRPPEPSPDELLRLRLATVEQRLQARDEVLAGELMQEIAAALRAWFAARHGRPDLASLPAAALRPRAAGGDEVRILEWLTELEDAIYSGRHGLAQVARGLAGVRAVLPPREEGSG